MPLFNAFKRNSYGSENPVLMLYKILYEIMIVSNQVQMLDMHNSTTLCTQQFLVKCHMKLILALMGW